MSFEDDVIRILDKFISQTGRKLNPQNVATPQTHQSHTGKGSNQGIF